jgi:hypothetical protein
MQIAPAATVVISFTRGIVASDALADSVRQRALSAPPAMWRQQTKRKVSEWLSQSVLQRTVSRADDPLLDFFEIGLLSMKLSQNPVLGTFVASFHPCYGFKTWARDATFSAMIMDAAGYHSEASLFLSWLFGKAEPTDNGAFHTCYSWWSGNTVGFVEPQYDSAGAALMALWHHYRLSQDKKLLDSVKTRVR